MRFIKSYYTDGVARATTLTRKSRIFLWIRLRISLKSVECVANQVIQEVLLRR
jgi:hypothetical protein